MLNQAIEPVVPLSRRDVTRLGSAALALVVILTVILGIDVFPKPLQIEVGSVATADIVAPRPLSYVSDVRTKELQAAAREAVDPQYDYTTAGAVEIAKEQLRLFDQRVLPVDQAFADGHDPGGAQPPPRRGARGHPGPGPDHAPGPRPRSSGPRSAPRRRGSSTRPRARSSASPWSRTPGPA